ncbi:MAG: beta-galactosidase, partial [bacterium]|nr:beta-galactosidase [Candidatus Colisoma equi]
MKFVLELAASLALASGASASVVPPYGLCVHKMHSAEDRAAAFPVMTSHGVGYVRCDFNWEWIEPAKGEWNFAPFDALLDDAEKQGLKVLPILHHGAAWTKPLMDHLDDWRVYVRRCIERYGSRIEAVEIWNEANIHAFPGPIGDYAKVLKIASEEIRAAAPQVKITTSGWAGVAIGHMEYLYRHVGRDAFDIVNFHHYSFGERPNGELEDCNLASEIGRLRDLMTKYGDRDKPMWLTECGYPTHDPSLVLHNIFKVQLPVFDPDKRNWRVRLVTLGTETENMVEGYARLMKEELPAGSDFKFVRANRLAGKLKEGGIDVIILPFHEMMPAGCTDELLAFIRQGGVVAQFGEAAMSYVVPQDADGVCRFR